MELNKPIATILILLITGLLAFLFVLPEYRRSGQLQVEEKEKEAEYTGKAAYYANISTLAENLESRKTALVKVDSALPEELSVAAATNFFQKKAAETGSVVKSVVFSDSLAPARDKIESKKLRSITFSVDLLGNYQGLKTFLLALEKSSRIFEVATISFSTLKDFAAADLPKTYDFKLEIKTYAY
ncbi:MAG TPA: type 4a pilus biogenesis protein PilO [Negativicutes bacterium]|nr:type 4a pilus biogenesis protein PilO [Negativicutes bacterium]